MSFAAVKDEVTSLYSQRGTSYNICQVLHRELLILTNKHARTDIQACGHVPTKRETFIVHKHIGRFLQIGG